MAALNSTIPSGSGPAAKNIFQPGVAGIGGGQYGSIFAQLSSGSRAPNAPIAPAKVGLPGRGEFGTPGATPVIGLPNRGDYGLGAEDAATARRDIGMARGVANKAQGGFNDPRSTGAFKSLMGLAGETTAAQAGEQSRHAADASQRRGYAGGFEDTARTAASDRMTALATAGFEGAQAVRQEEGAQYGRAIGAFAQLSDSYNQAMASGNTAFAHDLTQTHIAQAENAIKTMDLNQQQQLHYADALNQAKQLQAQLNEQFNKDLIDNNRFIAGQQQIATQLAASLATLKERGREFDITARQTDEAAAEKARQFDLGLKANPATALRTFQDPRYGGGVGPTGTSPGKAFTGLA